MNGDASFLINSRAFCHPLCGFRFFFCMSRGSAAKRLHPCLLSATRSAGSALLLVHYGFGCRCDCPPAYWLPPAPRGLVTAPSPGAALLFISANTKPPPDSSGGGFVLSFQKLQARRRRAANPQSASRLSIAVAGSGTATVYPTIYTAGARRMRSPASSVYT